MKLRPWFVACLYVFPAIAISILIGVLASPSGRALASGIAQAVIPQAVPAASKIGNGTRFQLASPGAVSGDCPTFDAGLNLTGPGTGVGCGGGGGTSGGGLTVYSGTAGVALSGTIFFPVGGGSAANATETAVDADISASTTISRFGVNLSAALGGGNSVVFTWRKNAASQTLTCTITNPNTSCADTVNSFTVVPGDLIAIQAVFTGTIVVTPTFVLTAQVGTLLSGNVNSGTQFQVAEYTGAGTTTGVAGVSIPNCPDTTGNHVNFASATGVFTCGTSGGGGSVTSSSITALPGTCTSGSLFLITDSLYESALCGASNTYTFYYRGAQVTPPAGTFSFTNQSGASVTKQTNGIWSFIFPALAPTGQNIILYDRAVPATPYTMTFRIATVTNTVATGIGSGVSFRESSSGRIECFHLGENGAGTGGPFLSVDRFTSPTAFTQTQATSLSFAQGTNHGPEVLRLADDGTTLTFSWSTDNGVNFVTLYSEARNAFFTTAPSNIGIFGNNSKGNNSNIYLTLIGIN
jgi:hypothetical protein